MLLILYPCIKFPLVPMLWTFVVLTNEACQSFGWFSRLLALAAWWRPKMGIPVTVCSGKRWFLFVFVFVAPCFATKFNKIPCTVWKSTVRQCLVARNNCSCELVMPSARLAGWDVFQRALHSGLAKDFVRHFGIVPVRRNGNRLKLILVAACCSCPSTIGWVCTPERHGNLMIS